MIIGNYFDGAEVISTTERLLTGRAQITTPINVDEQLDLDTIQKILRKAFTIHNKNAQDINYLYQFYKGNQPILHRGDKIVRPEIDNRVVENWAKFVADFKIGFIWGEPIQFIKNSNNSTSLVANTAEPNEQLLDKQVLLINEYFQENDKHNKDKEVGFWAVVAGQGYMGILPNQDEGLPFSVYSLDPRSTFVIYSADFKKEPVMAVTFNVAELLDDGNYTYSLTVYTKKYNYVFNSNNELNNETTLKVTPNALNTLPIVEINYDSTRQGGFESVIPLLNNINLIASDRINDVVQAVQWFMKFINVDIDDELYEKFKSKGVIVVKGEPGLTPVVDSVVNTLDQTQIQVFKDDMVKAVHILSKIPERNANPGGNTGQALIVGQGWADAESEAKAVESHLKAQQRNILRLALRICKQITNVPTEVKNAKIETIDIKFTRNRSDNLIIKTQSLKNMLDVGVHPLLAFKLCGLFDDPQKAYELSKNTLEEAKRNLNKGISQNEGEGPITSGKGSNEGNQSRQAQKEIDKKD